MSDTGFFQGATGARRIVIIIVALLVLIIAIQNTQVVTIQLLFWQVAMSRILFFLLTLLAGFGIGYLTCSVVGRKKKRPDSEGQ